MDCRALVPLLLTVALAAGDEPLLRINEVLFDPPGPDGGAEFVELFHGGAVPLPLEGFELWFLNGAAPDDAPRVVWRARAGTAVAPGGFWVVGGDAVPRRDDTTELGLQNGPDALWLVYGGMRVDALAWGAEAAALGEGEAAAQVSSASLGRVPDGVDTDDNARDFRRLATPTPGAENLPATALEPVSMEVDPAWRASPGAVLARVAWVAEGWAPRQAAEVELGGERFALELAAQDTFHLERNFWLPDGRTVVSAVGTSRRLERVLQTGTSALVLTEVQARPATGEPEWVELWARDGAVADAGAWSIADLGAVARRIGGELSLASGERLVLTADPEAWTGFHPRAEVRVLRPEGGWSTLNDSDRDDGPADGMLLFDPDLVVVDAMSYRAAEIAVRGRSLQRTGGVRDGQAVWIGSLGGPTPGAGHPAEAQGSPPPDLQAAPDPFTPDDDGVDDVLEIVAPRLASLARAEVRDLAGVLVRELEGVVADDRAYWQWDGRDARGEPVRPGAYVVLVRSHSDAGEVEVRRTVVGLDRRW